jgi:NhaP-type Na+/H+ or K+/H+ antiporter
MLLSIGLVSLIAYYLLDFSLPAAILLGAVLAPTDPVLASDVQVAPPMEGDRTHVKFALTAEAGMNDGTAFPFTWLAIALATGHVGQHGLQHWASYYLLYKIAVGIGCGFFIGRILSWLFFRLPEAVTGMHIRDGFVALSITLLVYGVAELAHGYGFIAVFIAAITIRNYEMHHKFHQLLHEFTDQVERILVAIVLLLFGGSLVTGILDKLTWPLALFALVFVFVVRPLTGLVSLWGVNLHLKEKLAIGFFGIKGIGSFYYLAFALQQTFLLKTMNYGQWVVLWLCFP